MAKIVIKNMDKSYDHIKVLNQLNIEINDGELVSLLGASGSGKTTILHLIGGFIEQDCGDIYLDNHCINDTPVEKRNVAIVDQRLLLFPHLTVAENISFGLKMRKKSKEVIHGKVEELLKLVELEDHYNKRIHELSGGQKQRVAIARALAIEPRVLLLDEPFSKLDINLRRTLQTLVANVQKKLNMTTILVTHDKEEAMLMSDRIALLINGEIVQYDKPEVIYEKPETKEVSEFFGNRVFIHGNIVNNKFITGFGEFLVDLNDKSEVVSAILEEDITVGDDNDLRVKVIEKSYRGLSYHCVGELDNFQFQFYLPKDYKVEINDYIGIGIDFEESVFFTKYGKKFPEEK